MPDRWCCQSLFPRLVAAPLSKSRAKISRFLSLLCRPEISIKVPAASPADKINKAIVKRILILTAGFGEGHNSAARGVRAGLARVAPRVEVELRDLFPETFSASNEIVRRAYLTLINRWPKLWGYVYNWLDRKNDFDQRFQRFRGLKKNLGRLIDRFQPDAVVSTF